MHDASLAHHADYHCPLCRSRKCSDQYCTCARPAATPDAKPKRYVREMFYCRGDAERCLEEVQIAPHATFFALTKSPPDMVSCRQDTAPTLNVKRYLINYPHLSDYGQTIFCLSFPSRDRATAPGRYEQFYFTKHVPYPQKIHFEDAIRSEDPVQLFCTLLCTA